MATSKILTVGALSGKGVYLNPLTNKIELRLKIGSGLSVTDENELTFSGDYLTRTAGQTLVDNRIAEKVKDASTAAKGVFRLASYDEVQASASTSSVPTVTDVNTMISKSVRDLPTNTSVSSAISRAIEAIPAPTIPKASAIQDGLMPKELVSKIDSLAAASGNLRDIEDKINTSLQTALAEGGVAYGSLTTAIQSALNTALAGYVKTTALTAALQPYAKSAALSDYVQSSALTTALEPYAKTAALSDYVQSSALTAALEPYAKTTALSGYVPTTALDTLATKEELKGYAKLSALEGLNGGGGTVDLTGYVKTTDLNTTLEGYAKATAIEGLATKESLKDYVKTTELSEKVLAIADVTIQDSTGTPLAKAFPA